VAVLAASLTPALSRRERGKVVVFPDALARCSFAPENITRL